MTTFNVWHLNTKVSPEGKGGDRGRLVSTHSTTNPTKQNIALIFGGC